MNAIFVARGPSFRSLPVQPSRLALAGKHNMAGFDNVEISGLVADLLGVPFAGRAPDNGTRGFWGKYLRNDGAE